MLSELHGVDARKHLSRQPVRRRRREGVVSLVEPELFDAGIRALYRTAETDGVFCYTFFKVLGEKALGG